MAGVLTPALFAALIIGYACVTHLGAIGLAGAVFVDLALRGISAVTLTEVLRAVWHRKLQQQRASALTVQSPTGWIGCAPIGTTVGDGAHRLAAPSTAY